MNGKKLGKRNRDYTHIFLYLLFLFGILAQASQASSLTSVSTYTNPNGLVRYYDFSDHTGTSIIDRSDWADSGALTNTPSWTQGYYGTGLSFASASSQYGQSGAVLGISGASARTMSFWVKLISDSAINCIAGWGNGTTTGNNFYVFAYNSQWYMNWFGDDLYFGTTNTNWNYIAITYDGVYIRTYLNGVYLNTATIALNTSSAKLELGRRTYDGNYLNGNLDEVKIWNRALSAEEIYVDYLGTFGNITKWYQGLSTGNITLCATATALTQVSTDTNTTKTNTATLLTNLNQVSTNVNATATATQANQISTDVNATITSANTLITNIEQLSTDVNTTRADMGNNFTDTNALINGITPTCNYNPEITNVSITNETLEITVNNTNTTNNYNTTINNSYPVNIIVNDTNSTINNSIYLQTQLDNATLKRISREVAFYLPDYQAQYDALNNFNHPILLGYALPFPYITIIILAVFFIICAIAGVSFGLWLNKKIGLERRFK